ncbi:hypothetical protein BOTBODRAFT_37004 [Botryobasidium botryosum FD-172 SS1]|uniref:Uncharacterized protein n=1 Tax=Botryobasidium botryosum (strain FD-172 SS1) TaxID=930990 RepID=A0A067M404_BOTB1|nr:hypothetical protein BOTBODRAFT_37004 [Botryobasidium botryosum FD-172 SS1]
MAPTITLELLVTFLSSFLSQLACGEDTQTSASFTLMDMVRELEVIRWTPDTAATHELARQIRSHLNRHSLFHRLPTEVICTIFHFAVENVPVPRDIEAHEPSDDLAVNNVPRDGPAKHAVRISSVSRLWREIATQKCATLWTHLDTLPIPLLDLFLSRSRSAPLEVVFDASTACGVVDTLHFFELVVPHIHRWRACCVLYEGWREGGDECEFFSLLEPALAAAAQLEILQLSEIELKQPDTFPLKLLETSSGIAPHPRMIDLDVGIPMNFPVYRGLTKLRLAWFDYDEPDGVHQLLCALGLCPLLESITLERLAFSAIPTARVSNPVITLPHLQELLIEEDGDTRWAQLHFLPCITIPVSCILKIDAHGDDLSHLLPRRSNFLPNMPDIQSVRVSYMGCSWDRRRPYVQGKMLAVNQDTFRFNLECDSDLHNAGNRDIFPRIILSIGRMLPLPLLEEVVLSRGELRDSDPTPALRSFLRLHPTIKIVALNGYWPWSSILELFIVTRTRQLCPLLQDLCLGPFQGLDESVLLAVVKSRTASVVGSRHLRGVTPLLRLFLDPRRERLSTSALSTLTTHVTVGFKRLEVYYP